MKPSHISVLLQNRNIIIILLYNIFCVHTHLLEHPLPPIRTRTQIIHLGHPPPPSVRT